MSTDQEPDYYRILNVHHQADPEIIEAAYHHMREKYRGAAAAERDIEAAYAVLSSPEERAAYDARRRRSRGGAIQPVPKPDITDAPGGTIMPAPEPPADPDRSVVPAKCSLTGQGFDIVLLRTRGPLPRFRVVGFEPWPSGPVEEPRKGGHSHPPHAQSSPPPPAAGKGGRSSAPAPDEDAEYLEFSKMDFVDHRCPVCAGQAPPHFGMVVRWAMCGRCHQILCMGGADDDPRSKAVTCPWCGTTLNFGGAPGGGGRVRASSRPPMLDSKPETPRLPPAKKSLPRG